MKLHDLKYDYPEDLVATEPQRPSRVLWVEGGKARELTPDQLLAAIPSGDVLVVNNTQVLKRRVFAGELEILFLSQEGLKWQVLFPSKKHSVGAEIELPLGRKMKLIQKGRPQVVETDQPLNESYFSQVAELPLPPYIQKARGARHTVSEDESWYQTAWASKPGSFAAPTASLHFSSSDIAKLKSRGVKILEVTLHVGLGTFLPVTAEYLDQHEMHEEFFEMPREVFLELEKAKNEGRKVWALGTTATRTLESATAEKLSGFTKLLIQPGYRWKRVDRLLTNFHQPESTLLALVAGFSDLETVKQVYQQAIEKKFRLFSYGDLSVWIR